MIGRLTWWGACLYGVVTMGIFFALQTIAPSDSHSGSPSWVEVMGSIGVGVLLGAGFGLLMRFVSSGRQAPARRVQALTFVGLFVAMGGVVMQFAARPQWFVITDIAACCLGYLLCCTLFLTPLRYRLLASNKMRSPSSQSEV
ncbi:hypothetical protein V3G39_13945 [Dermatophilaceae bacterium Sec6.4]